MCQTQQKMQSLFFAHFLSMCDVFGYAYAPRGTRIYGKVRYHNSIWLPVTLSLWLHAGNVQLNVFDG